MENKVFKSNLLSSLKTFLPDTHTPLSSLTARPRFGGVQMRHPYICKRCCRFKLNSFFGSIPPKNFCICLPSTLSNRESPLPYTASCEFLAIGKSLSCKNLEVVASEAKLSKQTRTIRQNKPKEVLFELTPRCKFLVFPGNNSELVKKIWLENTDWVEGEFSNLFELNFVWQPFLKTQTLKKNGGPIINHLECHFEISNKCNLYKNLSGYCRENFIDLGSVVPLTFLIDFKSKIFASQIGSFVSFFKGLRGESKLLIEGKGKNNLPATHFIGQNVWLIKPADNNRGRGIKVFSSLKSLKIFVKEQVARKAEKKSVFVIQKYIESPLLINSRKFDIRVWVLITGNMKCYFYKEGYIRTSSEVFSLEEPLLADQFVHLTNNAVQKTSPKYNKFEQGNQISFQSFKALFSSNQDFDFDSIMTSIKSKISLCLKSCIRKLNPNHRDCFELFGFDFIIDSSFTAWLIECNTNPCIELSSPLLEELIPAMLTQAFALSIQDFPKTGKNNWEMLLDNS